MMRFVTALLFFLAGSEIRTACGIPQTLAQVNSLRSDHNVPVLVWNSTAAAFAKSWATTLASTGMFAHSNTRIYGENIAMVPSSSDSLQTAIKLWYDEVVQYNFSAPGFYSNTGHFTCLVWASSRSFGIDKATTRNNYDIVVFEIYPPCNYLGAFESNVFPKQSPLPVRPVIPPPPIRSPVIPRPPIRSPVIPRPSPIIPRPTPAHATRDAYVSLLVLTMGFVLHFLL
jgi:hypothetical protein